MKITLPESIADITLGQYQRFDKLSKRLDDGEIDENEFIKRKITLFSGIPYRKIDDVVLNDLESVVLQIDKALALESPFVNRFTLNGVEFGFVENLNGITTGEYVDLKEYGTDIEQMHKLMAILFRPIVKEDKFKNYKVVKYSGSSEYAETMRGMSLSIVNGSLVFFCNLSRELRKHIQKSTEALQEKADKHQHTLKNGGGTVPSMN